MLIMEIARYDFPIRYNIMYIHYTAYLCRIYNVCVCLYTSVMIMLFYYTSYLGKTFETAIKAFERHGLYNHTGYYVCIFQIVFISIIFFYFS